MPVKKENLFQSEGFRSVRAAILTIVIGMLFGLVVLLLVTTPQNAFGAFRELITGGFLSMGLNNGIAPRQQVTLRVQPADAEAFDVPVIVRIDTPIEKEYYLAGGILQYVLTQILR